jgi:hypothetical protein
MFPLEEWRLLHQTHEKILCILKKLIFGVTVVISPVFSHQKPRAGCFIAYLASERSVKVVEIAIAPTWKGEDYKSPTDMRDWREKQDMSNLTQCCGFGFRFLGTVPELLILKLYT